VTILQELAALYDRRAKRDRWSPPNFSTEKIAAEIVLSKDGTVLAIRSLMYGDEKGKLQPRPMHVPAAVSRSRDIRPNRFWDKSEYALGVTLVEDESGRKVAGHSEKTLQKHDAFKSTQLGLISNSNSAALKALRGFCEKWSPELFFKFDIAIELVDRNFVFALDGEKGWIHDLAEVALLLQPELNSATDDLMCLVTGQSASVARLHPSIKGVQGAQSSGPPLVSFNEDAFTSYGKLQGNNAPVSQSAAFAYGTALNALLARDSRNTLRIADTSVVFWALAETSEAENAAEEAISLVWGRGRDENADEQLLRDNIKSLGQGQIPIDNLHPNSRFFILGLAPNAARLSVRFWYSTTLGHLAANIFRFWSECAIEPSPFRRGGLERLPKPWSLLFDLAAHRDAANIPSNLGGQLMRSIMSGTNYPSTLLSTVLGRLRVEGEADKKHGNVDGRRASMIRATLIRNHREDVPMALNEEVTDVAYLLGRLFGAFAYAETSYQARGASLRSKYLGAASATPARIFPVLMRGYEHNLTALKKSDGQKAGIAVVVDKAVTRIMNSLPGGGELPTSLPLEEQGRFFIGFYQQDRAFYTKSDEVVDAAIEENVE